MGKIRKGHRPMIIWESRMGVLGPGLSYWLGFSISARDSVIDFSIAFKELTN